MIILGTDKCPLATGRSKNHAEAKNLVHYDYVLHPRTTGFAHFLNQVNFHTETFSTHYIDYLQMRKRKFYFIDWLFYLSGFKQIILPNISDNYIDHVYDCTVAYPTEIVQSEVDLFVLGACPKNIHFDIRKIDVKDLPNDEKEIGQWLTTLWKHKEERLRKYYSKPVDRRELDSLPGDVEFTMSMHTRVLQISIVIVV